MITLIRQVFRRLFCVHVDDQRYWGEDEHGVICVNCGRIEYRDGPGGPMPDGVAREQKVGSK